MVVGTRYNSQQVQTTEIVHFENLYKTMKYRQVCQQMYFKIPTLQPQLPETDKIIETRFTL